MKTKKNLVYCLLFVFIVFTSQAISQTYNDDTTVEEEVTSGANLSDTYLQSLGINNGSSARSQALQGNSVFLTQIGELNQLSVRTSTVASDINVTQDGYQNFASLTYVANTAIANLTQLGDLNTFTDFVNDPTANVELDLVQEGNNLSFQREGVNELTKSIKFRQSEGTPNLIIRSFN